MSEWNVDDYKKFLNERTEPVRDLISKLNINPLNILDIGSGPGNSTYELKKVFDRANIIGIDQSKNMVMEATLKHPDLKFIEMDAMNLRPLGKFDLIFSNACIHWISDQNKLFDSIHNALEIGGVVAIQLPLTYESDFYKLLYKMLDNNPKWNKLKSIKVFHQLTPEGYYDLLLDKFSDFKMWETVYYHKVLGLEGVIEWYKGSGLKPYLDALNDNEKNEFLNDLQEEINKSYKLHSDNSVILKMPRLFFIAYK